MPRNPKVDQYILKSPEYAQEILIYLRELIHAVCPEVEEKMKWGMPFFDYNNDMLCHAAAFKKHCAFGFWKASLFTKNSNVFQNENKSEAMGNFGKITSLQDLPNEKVIIALLLEAMSLNDKGIKLPPKPKEDKNDVLEIPFELSDALANNLLAAENFNKFSLSKKKEYALWIADAKSEKTKTERVLTAIAWLEEGKSRNWKYEAKYKK